MKKIVLHIFAFILFCEAKAQEAIDVAELVIKIGTKEEEKLHYVFEKGDNIVFSCSEVNERDIKEVEVSEYPNTSRFQDYEVKKIEGKKISVPKRAIYVFRFMNNNSVRGRVCKVKIQRIPQSKESNSFNTAVTWVTKYDTTYTEKTETVTIGYRTVEKQRSRRVLDVVDTTVISVLQRKERVHSKTNMNASNTASVTIELPKNIVQPNEFLPYSSSEVVAWAYSLAVDGSGEVWYKNANTKAIIKGGAKLAGMASGGSAALVLLAVEGIDAFSNPPSGNNVIFKIHSTLNGQPIVISRGNSVTASGRVDTYKQGSFELYMENDNMIDGINVQINVIAIVVNKKWKDEYYTVTDEVPIKEKQTKKIPNITSEKIPTISQD